MPQSRKSQISLIDTSFYHCISRCVRQSFLCGVDAHSGHSYEHRRDWVEERLLFLTSVFAIDICAYAVMSNHTHVVLCVDKALADGWDTNEILQRYHRVHKGTLITQKFMHGDSLSQSELISLDYTVEIYRKRLYDISWFMRDLNEFIAREANKEDDCTGRFWEGRFKSQALLDESAVLACMAYVDLNPIRAKMAETPETSKHTSIKKRIDAAKNQQSQPRVLMPFVSSSRDEMLKGIAYSFNDYCELIDTTSRCIRDDNLGYMDNNQSPILERLGLATAQWLTLTTEFEKHFCYAAGAQQMMNTFKRHTHHQRLRGMGKAKELLKQA
ncbi:transposase [Paraglaciecola chathamensis]|uniref:transposase n=1 Tax=Paraglaciecola chathamensis TaxID=368405 RepID=UPI0027084D33|nr:transposase [Paraglaciecola chathamensis]MDO6560736.1 transposase [Paraglaciecola chathamensis]